MNRVIRTLLLVILCVATLAAPTAAQILRFSPMDADAGQTISVVLRVTDATVGEPVVISDLIPKGAALLAWSVEGSKEPVYTLSAVRDGNSVIWEFTAATAAPAVTYTLRLPQRPGTSRLSAVYAAAPDTFGHAAGAIEILPSSPSAADALPIPSELERPATVPDTVPFPAPMFAAIAVIVTLLGAFLYLRSRAPDPFAADAQELPAEDGWRSWFLGLRLSLAGVFGERRPEPVSVVQPVGLSAYEEATLLGFPQRQRDAIARLDAMEHELSTVDVDRYAAIERLKREILSIEFSVAG